MSGLLALWYAIVLLRDGVRPGWPALLLIVFWIYFTYLLLPRLHRILTRLYLPGYFIGRTRTSDGLLGDPVNLGLLGQEGQVHTVMRAAGWTMAEDLGLGSGVNIVHHTLRRRSYPSAPVSPLHLFNRRQDFAYQRQVAGSPAKRHHVRFWRCPEGWLLPGGFTTDWLAAATYDRSVGLSLFTLQITHKIEEDIDIERDFVLATVTEAEPWVRVSVLEKFSSGYHARNGGGDLIRTDGNLPILDVRDVPVAEPVPVTKPEPKVPTQRPAPITVGGAVALLRAAAYVALFVVLFVDPGHTTFFADFGLSREDIDQVTEVLATLLAVAALADAALGFAILAGYNWARIGLMAVCAVTAMGAFVASVGRLGHPIGIGSLPSLGASVLVLLALSSPSARDWAIGGAR
jgi:hypothetical protein